MKIGAMMAAAVLAVTFAHAGEERGIAERGVILCVDSGATTEAGLAQAIAGKMFANIGINTIWKVESDCPAAGDGVIHVILESKRSCKQLPGVLAFARPFEGIHIHVFVDRLRKMVDPKNIPSLLAHVLAHEITHILQGTNRHSEDGVMKANWSPLDMSQMRCKPLDFTELDVRMIHAGLDAWVLRSASVNR